MTLSAKEQGRRAENVRAVVEAGTRRDSSLGRLSLVLDALGTAAELRFALAALRERHVGTCEALDAAAKAGMSSFWLRERLSVHMMQLSTGVAAVMRGHLATPDLAFDSAVIENTVSQAINYMEGRIQCPEVQ